MGDVEVHDQLVARPEISLVDRDEQILGSEVGGRYVQSNGLDHIDPHHVAGESIDAFQPPGVGAQTELLGDEVGRRVGAAGPHAEHRAGVAVGIVLVRPATEPAQLVEPAGQREPHADAREIGQRRGHADTMPVRRREAVVGHAAIAAMPDQLVGRGLIEACLLPQPQCLAADAKSFGELREQLEAVVVGRSPPEGKLDGQHQQVVECRRRGRCSPSRGAGSSASGSAQLGLIPCNQLALRGEPAVVPSVPPNGELHFVAARRHRARQRHADGLVRTHLRHAQPTVLRHVAIDQQFPRGDQIVETHERSAVGDAQRTGAHAAVQRHGDRPVDPGDLAHGRMRFEIGRDEPVRDEVAVVWCVAEVAAVGKALAAVLQPTA